MKHAAKKEVCSARPRLHGQEITQSLHGRTTNARRNTEVVSSVILLDKCNVYQESASLMLMNVAWKVSLKHAQHMTGTAPCAQCSKDGMELILMEIRLVLHPLELRAQKYAAQTVKLKRAEVADHDDCQS